MEANASQMAFANHAAWPLAARAIVDNVPSKLSQDNGTVSVHLLMSANPKTTKHHKDIPSTFTLEESFMIIPSNFVLYIRCTAQNSCNNVEYIYGQHKFQI